VTIKPGDNSVSAEACLGDEKGWGRIIVHLDDGGQHRFEMRVEPDRFRKQVKVDGKTTSRDEALPDAVVSFSGLARYHSRPRLERYTAKQQEDMVKRWETLPAASCLAWAEPVPKAARKRAEPIHSMARNLWHLDMIRTPERSPAVKRRLAMAPPGGTSALDHG
jgi:hypothetical protein